MMMTKEIPMKLHHPKVTLLYIGVQCNIISYEEAWNIIHFISANFSYLQITTNYYCNPNKLKMSMHNNGFNWK